MVPKTLGEHLRKRRIQLGLLQRDVAKNVGVALSTFMTWERGQAGSAIRPRILRSNFSEILPEPPHAERMAQAECTWGTLSRMQTGIRKSARSMAIGARCTRRRAFQAASISPLRRCVAFYLAYGFSTCKFSHFG